MRPIYVLRVDREKSRMGRLTREVTRLLAEAFVGG